jgi:hypothetical protein
VTTERDVYEIDTKGSEVSLKRLADGMEQLAGMAEQSSASQAKSFFTAAAAFEVAKKALGGFVDLMKESVAAAAEAERTEKLLASVAGANTDAFKRQAAAFRDNLGVSDDMVMSLQTMALRFGAAPQQVEGLTRAVLDYSEATGQDAPSAMRTLLNGVEAGKDGMSKLGIQYKSTGEFTKDLTLLTQELSEKYGGSAALAAETMAGKTRILAERFGEAKESFGALLLELADKSGVLDFATRSIQGLQLAFGSREEQAAQRRRQLDVIDATNGYADALLEVKQATTDLEGAPEDAILALGNALEFAEKNAETWRVTMEKARAAAGMGSLSGQGREHSTGNADELEAKAAEKAKKAAEERADVQFKLEMQRRAAFREVAEEDEKYLAEKNEKELVSWKQVEERQAKAHEEEVEMAKKAADAMVNVLKEQAAEEARIREGMADFAKDVAKQALDFGLQLIRQELLAHRRFAAEFRAQTVETMALRDAEAALAEKYTADELDRMDETAYLKELETTALQKKTGIAKRLADEEAASNQKRLAEFLADIGQQATVRALFAAAEALAAAASQNYVVAGQHAAAAAAFGVVAVSAGAGAGALSQSRGYTEEERSNLEALEQERASIRDRSRAEREARNAKQTATESGPAVTVNYFGISGYTKTEQARHLEELRRTYARLKTGSA